MSETNLGQQLEAAQATICALQEELAETNRGLVALTLELEERVDARTEELRAAHHELAETNSELMQLTLELEDRVANRTYDLEVSETRYRRLFEAAKDGILILDADTGRIIDVNPFLTELTDYSHEDFLGKYIWEIGPLKDIAASKDSLAELQSKEYIRYEDLPLETRDGRRKEVEVVSNIYSVDNRRVIQCNIRDITERKRVEKELWGKNEELLVVSQQLVQAAKLATMGELAASIAHELNNPLATVSLRVELMLGATLEADPQWRALKVVEQEVERMGNLVANLLEFSRRGKQQISTIDVRDEIDRTLDLVHYRFLKHGVTVVKEFAPICPLILADRQQLRQVFLNLFTNAIDAMRKQGGTLTIRVGEWESEGKGAEEQAVTPALPLPHSPKQVVIEVSDTGPGIPPELMPKIMEPFFTTKPEGQGTGLGLPICHRIVEEHHGTMDLESELDKGTTIRLTFQTSKGGNGEYFREEIPL